MTTGPGDQRAAGAGRLRASHADREQVIGALKSAYVRGRLDKDEFDARVGQALASRTHAELATVIADIPVDPAGAGPAQPALGVRSGVRVTVTAAMLAGLLWAAAIAGGSAAALAAAVAVTGVVIFASCLTGDQMRQARHRKRPAGALPPGPVPGSG